MIGLEGVLNRIVVVLRDNMPAKIQEIRDRYDLQPQELEDIERYLSYEPDDVAIDKPPMIVVVAQETSTINGPTATRIDGAGGAAYVFRYQVVVFAWATGWDHESTAAARQRYGLAVREILLQHPGIGDPDPDLLRLRLEDFAETYSPVGQDTQANRELIAATAITVQYDSYEFVPARVPGPPLAGTQVGITPGR